MPRRYTVITLVTMFILLVFGFWLGPSVTVRATKAIIENQLVLLRPEEAVSSALAGGILLAFCAPAAMAMLWAYSRKRSGWPRTYGFFVCLLVGLTSAVGGVGLRMLLIGRLLKSLVDPEHAIPFGFLSTEYFQWGFGAVIVVCGAITAVLFMRSLQRVGAAQESLE